MIKKIKNITKTNKYFWKFRHLVQRNIWHNYYTTHSNKRRNYYSNFVKINKCHAIFEFGCASGPNLKNLRENVEYPTHYYGYDINKGAIEFAKIKLGKHIVMHKIVAGIFD